MPVVSPALKPLPNQGFDKEVTGCTTCYKEFIPFTFSPVHSPNQAQQELPSPLILYICQKTSKIQKPKHLP